LETAKKNFFRDDTEKYLSSLKKVVFVSESTHTHIIRIKNYIWRRNAFKDDQTLHCGLSNHCDLNDKRFHLFLDCDEVKIRKQLDCIAKMKKKFKELRSEKFQIINTSPDHFSIVAFASMSWAKYRQMLWYAVKIGLAHDGYAFYSTSKRYAVLRLGAKDGIVPKIMYSIGDAITCKQCSDEFEKILREDCNGD
jgi:hypothetical protein